MKVWHVWRAISVVLLLSIILLGLGPAARPVWAAPHTGTYIVRPGDTLYSIARRHNTTVSELMRLNHLSDPNRIQVGQVLLVPGGAQAPAVSDSSSAASVPIAVPTTAPAPTVTSGCTYRVQPGDTLYRISRKFGVPVLSLARSNGLSLSSVLRVGQILTIPSATCGAADHFEPQVPLQLPWITPGVPTATPIPVPGPAWPPGSPSVPSPSPQVPDVDASPEVPTPRVRILPTPTPTPARNPLYY